MKLLHRYILQGFFRIFGLALATFVGIYLLVDFFEKVDQFMANEATIGQYVGYFLIKIPLIATQVTPLAVLMAVFMTLGGLSRSNEITAMRSGGLSLLRISLPLVAVALFISFTVLVASEFLTPICARKSNHLLHTEVRGKPEISYRRDRIWFREGSQLINIRLANPEQGTLQGLTIYQLGANELLERRIDATSAQFQEGGWQLEKGTVRSFEGASGNLSKLERFETLAFPLGKTPKDFQVVETKKEELSFSELRSLAKKFLAEGYDATRYRVDMHARLATPFACLIMAFLGIPFALQKGRHSSIALGIAVSVAIGVSFFILQSIALALGYSSVLPPLVAAWSANLLFALFGLWLILSVRE